MPHEVINNLSILCTLYKFLDYNFIWITNKKQQVNIWYPVDRYSSHKCKYGCALIDVLNDKFGLFFLHLQCADVHIGRWSMGIHSPQYSSTSSCTYSVCKLHSSTKLIHMIKEKIVINRICFLLAK